MVNLNNYIYFTRQKYPGYTDTLFRCHKKTKQWSEVVSMKYYACNSAQVSCNYVIGGQIDQKVSNAVQKYDPSTDSWTECAPMQVARFDHSVTVHKNYIYATGGAHLKGYGFASKSVERYDTIRDLWEVVAPMNMERRHHGICTYRDKIYVAGTDAKCHLTDKQRIRFFAEVYDPLLNVWTEFTTMIFERLKPSELIRPRRIERIRLMEVNDLLYMISDASMTLKCTPLMHMIQIQILGLRKTMNFI